ncbi:MAG TPA: substrate-binding domain-containing protein [Cytophagaceae bacterium]|nr:substrate-binding domain-containing protein [Cytophagaceae bacterium]
MKPTIINIGGVPEHFNQPWHEALAKGLFSQKNIDLHWTDYPGGTGAMNKDLRSGILDAAVILTEGIVADIAQGNETKIVQWYVKSPLVWGIHTGAHSPVQNDSSFAGKKYAISRYGSGSHLMAFVDAHQRGLTIRQDQFVVVNNLDGAVKALSSGEADLFMWEKFMTKPLVDQGIFRRVGECPTPWPSFVIAVRTKFLEENPEAIQAMLSVIREACKEFYAQPDAAEKLSAKFNLQLADVQEWMKAIRWQTEASFDPQPLKEVINTLVDLKIIEKQISVRELCK